MIQQSSVTNNVTLIRAVLNLLQIFAFTVNELKFEGIEAFVDFSFIFKVTLLETDFF